MPASQIMIIRHAEKPIPGKVHGVRARGQPDDASLTALGWQRAGALAGFFEKPRTPAVRRPDHLFAVRFDISDTDGSRRSKQTLRPLARLLGLAINDRFGKEQEGRLAQALERLNGVVLIAWSHETIPRLASRLAPGLPVPIRWPDDRFDLVWVFDRTERRLAFSQVAQRLLAGDSDEAIPLEASE